MATTPTYSYIPVYGVEDYVALDTPESSQLGGGANFTNDNLMVSLWTNIETDDDTDYPISGDLVKPVYAFGEISPITPPSGPAISNVAQVGWRSSMNSRVASRFIFRPDGKADVSFPLVAFLHPPSELLQALSDAFRFASDGSVVVNRSLLDSAAWDVYTFEGDVDGQRDNSVVDTPTYISSLFTEDTMTYYVGNGSDGVFPTPLPTFSSILAGYGNIQDLIDGLKQPNLSVGMLFFPTVVDTALTYTIKWPHSIGRG